MRASFASSKTPCDLVSVQVKSVSGKPAFRTIFAASGSTKKLYSAAGVMFPSPPPMRYRCPTLDANDGLRCTAVARFVSGA